MHRRQLLKLFNLSVGLGWAGLSSPSRAAPDVSDPWLRAQAIIDRVRKPLKFRDEDFPITRFGALRCTVSSIRAFVSHTEQGQMDAPQSNSPDCHAAIAAAIAACQQAGGGRVLIPGGNWYCAGPVVLKSNVHVHLESGAHLYFSNDPFDYARHGAHDCGVNGKLEMTRWQGNDCLNYASMVYAHGQDNIALTGADWSSILDGQGGVPFADANACWWTWKGKDSLGYLLEQERGARPVMSGAVPNPVNAEKWDRLTTHLSPAESRRIRGEGARWMADEYLLPAYSEAGVPADRRVFGKGHYLRPSMIHLIGCTNVLLQGYQVTNTPFWQHHPVNCKNLWIRDVHANSLGPNSDGFDPEGCQDVLVENCTFDTGDDCIAIKSGKNKDTQYGPSRNIVIQNCIMQSGHGAITLGSEMAAGIQDVYVQDIVMQNIHWKTNPLNTAIRLKTNMNRGGYLRDLYVRRVAIPNGVQTTPSFYKSLPGSPIHAKSVASAAGAVITIDCDYAPSNDSVRNRPPSVSNVHISEVVVGNVKRADGEFSCYQAIVILGPVRASFNGAEKDAQIQPVSGIAISHCDFGRTANGTEPVYLYNVSDLKLEDVMLNGKRISTSLNSFVQDPQPKPRG